MDSTTLPPTEWIATKKLEDIKQSLSDFFSSSDERLKDNLSDYMISIVAEHKKTKIDSRKRKFNVLNVLGALKALEEYDSIIDEDAEYIILPKKRKFHNIELLDEIWRKIFSYLPTQVILGKVARVCKRFNEITKDPTLLKSVKIKNISDYDNEYVLKVLERSKCLTKLSVIDCNNFKDLLLVALKSNSHLKTLILFHTYKKRNQVQMCEEIVKMIETNGTNLEHLYIRMHVTKSALKHMVHLEKLKTLHINNRKTIIGPEIVGEIGKNYKSLEVLHLTFKDYDEANELTGNIQKRMVKLDEMKSSLKSFFQTQKTLKKFSFNCDSMFAKGLFEAIDLCPQLEHFSSRDAVCYSMNKAEIEAIGRLQKLKNLSLCIDANQLDFAMFGIANALPNIDENAVLNSFMNNACFEEMEYLDLSSIEKLSTDNLQHLSNRSLPKLIVLNLSFCAQVNLIDDILTRLVSNCPRLKHLQASGVNMEHVSDELLYELQKKHILVNMNREKEHSVEKYIKYNVPIAEKPPTKSFLQSSLARMKYGEEDLNYMDFSFFTNLS